MPAATTHYEFVCDVYDHLPTEIQQKITSRALFNLGSQGPDLLFFSKLSILPGSLKKYGNQMHEQKINEVLDYFFDISRNSASFRSYYYGYLCHYAMDSTIHPIVCYEAKKRHEQNGEHEGAAHVTIEAELDIHTLKTCGKTSADYNVYKYLKVSKEERNLLAGVYHDMLLKVFDVYIKENDIREAIDSISKLTKFLRPNSEKKYHIVQRAEKALKMPSAISGMMLNEKNEPWLINETHEEYDHFFYGKDSSSYQELYDQSLNKAVEFITQEKITVDRDFLGHPISN